MNPRERWQTLQSHLSAARGALATGDRTTALEHIESALEIDPEFLAARMLRDRVMSPEPDVSAVPSAAPTNAADVRITVAPQPVQSVAPPTVSLEALASFEERVMQRVRDREAVATHAAVAKQQRWRIGAQLAAAAAFLTAVSGTTLYEPRILQSRNLAMSASLVDLEPPAPIVVDDIPDRAPVAVPEQPLLHPAPNALAVTAMVAAPPEPLREPPAAAPQPQPPATQPSSPAPQLVAPATTRPVQMLPPRPMPDATVASNVAPPSAPAVVPALLVSTVDDRSLVDQTLQRYRRAYNRLDAQSAQAVYPAVNAGALARAFDSLESQSLSFDSCDMQLQARYATVTCHGTSRYVPKIGNHVPRVEPRIWSFTLRKDEGDWKIENARAGGGR